MQGNSYNYKHTSLSSEENYIYMTWHDWLMERHRYIPSGLVEREGRGDWRSRNNTNREMKGAILHNLQEGKEQTSWKEEEEKKRLVNLRVKTQNRGAASSVVILSQQSNWISTSQRGEGRKEGTRKEGETQLGTSSQ